jgi:hypothetical protein
MCSVPSNLTNGLGNSMVLDLHIWENIHLEPGSIAESESRSGPYPRECHRGYFLPHPHLRQGIRIPSHKCSNRLTASTLENL